MPHPHTLRLAAALCAGTSLLGGGCLGHARPVVLDDPTALPVPERLEAPIEVRQADVELAVLGEPLDAAAADALRVHVARVLTRRLGVPAPGAGRAHTQLSLVVPRAPLVVTGPHQRWSFALETELPGGRVVRSAQRTVTADDDGLFALDQWAYLAATAQGALALALAGLGVAFAGDDPNQAASTLLFSALPVASGAALTAVIATSLRGHALAHERRTASDALLAALEEHATDIRDHLARQGEGAHVDAAAGARGASAVVLTLHDELGCLSQVDLERDLEALVPASSSARFNLDATVSPGAHGEVAVRLRLSDAAGGALLAERELVVARADCATLPRVVARIARKHIEAAAPAAGGAP